MVIPVTVHAFSMTSDYRMADPVSIAHVNKKMNRQLFFILLFFFSLIGTLRAQEIDENNFVHYTKMQGLSHNYISGITQDATRYIWIATHKGLNRFDGHFFSNF